MIDLTRSATPSPNRSQGVSVSSTEGFHMRGGSCRLGLSDTDSSSDTFGAAEAKKKFKFKKAAAPPQGNPPLNSNSKYTKVLQLHPNQG